MWSRVVGLILVAVVVGLGLPGKASAATCADYNTQAAAQAAADTIDADGDGIYCESLPCPCASGQSGSGGGSGGGGGSSDPRPAAPPARRTPAPAGARPLRAFYTPTRKSACVVYRRSSGGTFIECGVNSHAHGYRLGLTGRAPAARWQDPRTRFPGLAYKIAIYGRTLSAHRGAWVARPFQADIRCTVAKDTGITCVSPTEDHGLRVSVQYQRGY